MEGTALKGDKKDFICIRIFRIDIEKLNMRKIEGQGEKPGVQIGASMAFYSESLYLFGIDEGLNQNLLYKFDLISETWSIFCRSMIDNVVNYHVSYVYRDELFIFFGGDRYSTKPFMFIQRFNFASLTWTYHNFSSDFITAFSSVQYFNQVFVLFGQTQRLTQNSVWRFSLGDKIEKEILVDSADFPKKRKNHVSFVFDNEFYIFAGKSESGEFLNDMWKFNFGSLAWEKLRLFGSIPSGRELIAFSLMDGLGFTFTGGRNAIDVFSELYYFELKNKYFMIVDKTETWKSPRYSSCFIANNPTNVEIGGRDYNTMASDVFLYDYLKTRTTLFQMPEWFKLINHHCYISEFTSDSFAVSVIGGTSIEEVPNYNIYVLNFTGVLSRNFNVSISIKTTSDFLRTSDTAYTDSYNNVCMIGGSVWSEYINTEIVCYNLLSGNFSSEQLPSQLYLYGHSATHYKSNLYIFGGARGLSSIKTSQSYSNSLYKLSFDTNDKVYIGCSKGTVGEFCDPCEAGKFYMFGMCIPCRKGTFSNAIGARGFLECIPCDYGYYAELEGSTYCKKCSYGSYCPILSTKPLIIIENYKENSTQPSNYEPESAPIDFIRDNMWFIFLLSFLTLAFILSISESSRNFLICLDYFQDSHSQAINSPIKYRKTKLGGLFFLLFSILALLTCVLSILIYCFENITEIKTLVPIVTLGDEVEAETIQVDFTLLGYGGECVAQSTCSQFIQINNTGFTYKSRTILCKDLDTSCQIKLTYNQVTLNKDSQIQLYCGDLSASSSAILVSISSTSSIPNQSSSSFVPIFPDQVSLLFRGQSPTIIKYELIPSVPSIQLFYSESGKWSNFDSGYHIRHTSEISKGTQVNQKT